MQELTIIQKNFFKTLQYIQEQVVSNMLNNYNNNEMEDLFYEITFDVIVEILLMIDGYNDNMMKIYLIELNSKKSIKENIELHDECTKYLKFGI